MQIIVFALCTGVLSFGGFVLFQDRGAEAAQLGTLTMSAIGFAALGIVMSVILPGTITAAQRKKVADGTWQPGGRQGPAPASDAGKLAMVYQLKMIISAAFLEAPAFLALMAYMIEGHAVNLGIAGVLLLGLMAHFPTVGRVETWVEHQLGQVEYERQFPD
jgi:hypothetical protein